MRRPLFSVCFASTVDPLHRNHGVIIRVYCRVMWFRFCAKFLYSTVLVYSSRLLFIYPCVFPLCASSRLFNSSPCAFVCIFVWSTEKLNQQKRNPPKKKERKIESTAFCCQNGLTPKTHRCHWNCCHSRCFLYFFFRFFYLFFTHLFLCHLSFIFRLYSTWMIRNRKPFT